MLIYPNPRAIVRMIHVAQHSAAPSRQVSLREAIGRATSMLALSTKPQVPV